MTNHIEAVRRMARAVADAHATNLTVALFRVYLAAAGATVNGPWVYIPGHVPALKGFRAAARHLLMLPDTSAFLRAMANVLDLAEREIGEPLPAPPPIGLGQHVVTAEDMTPMSATADDLNAVARHVADLAAQLAAVAPKPPPRYTITIGDDCDLPTLAEAQEHLAKRIVKRTAYDTGKAMLDVLAGWIEGVRENAGANDPEHYGSGADETFYPDDIRRMINDACCVMGAPEPWRKDEANA